MAVETDKAIPAVDESRPISSLDMAQSDNYIDPAVQRRTLLKVDTAVLGCFGIMYLLANLDRNNLGATNIMGLPEDLNLKGNEFGNAVTVFFATYVVFETPLSILLKIVGPRNLLSFCMLAWGAVCLGTGFVQNINQLYACRLLLGVFEAGLIPCINAYIGMVYLRSEMSVRAAVYYCFSAIAGAFGGLLASGVSNIRAGGLPAWSWLFIIEGVITMAFVPILFFVFPKDPRTAWFLNEEERAVMRHRYDLNRHLSADDDFSWAKILSAFKDPKMYVYAAVEFAIDLSLFGVTTFLPAIIRGMGYSSVHAQLLTVPVYVWSTVSFFILSILSDRTGMRSPFMLTGGGCLVIGYAIMLGTENLGARYAAAMFLAVGIYSYTGFNVVWLMSNTAGHFKRSTAVGFTFTIGNTAGVVVGQVFRDQDEPRYLHAVRIILGMTIFGMVLTTLTAFGLRHVNKKREQRLAARGPVEVVDEKEVTDYDDTFKYNY